MASLRNYGNHILIVATEARCWCLVSVRFCQLQN